MSSIAALAGAFGSAALAVAWNMIGWATQPRLGYELSHCPAPVSGASVLDFLAVRSSLRGRPRCRTRKGSRLALAIARDRTSHNLITVRSSVAVASGICLPWVAAYAGHDGRPPIRLRADERGHHISRCLRHIADLGREMTRGGIALSRRIRVVALRAAHARPTVNISKAPEVETRTYLIGMRVTTINVQLPVILGSSDGH